MESVFVTMFVLGLLACAASGGAEASGGSDAPGPRDWRNIEEGTPVPTPGMNYVDQPYVVRLLDGSWLCLVTLGAISETERPDQNFTACLVSRDRGKSWSAPVRSATVYATPLVTPGGRVYSLTPRSFSYSDDSGRTWSPLHRVPDDVWLVPGPDGLNAEGRHLGGWTVGLPLVADGKAYVPWAKIGLEDPPRRTEVFFNVSDNILTEKDPEKLRWERLPASTQGIRGPDFDSSESRAEEPHVAQLSDGTLYCVFRTILGHIGHSTSRDGGKTWSKPVPLAYTPGGRPVRHPLACPSLWKCANGRYLLWTHNHGGSVKPNPYADRNPVWTCGGVEKDGHIEWSQPEVLLYSDDLTYDSGRISYPGFIEDGNEYFIFETQKTLARMHEIDSALLEAAWGQSIAKGVPGSRLVLSTRAGSARMPRLPSIASRGGFSVEMWLTLDGLRPGQTVLDSTDRGGAGIRVTTAEGGSLRLDFSDGERSTGWDTDAGLISAGRLHHVIFIVDGGPRIISVVVDGQLCDGGTSRQHGFGRIADAGSFGDVSGAETASAGEAAGVHLERLRIYGRYLLTSEAVASFRAGPAAEPAAE